ncbi:MAG: tetratricopeptide repeat protein [Alphaproteobacteria bacterium]
MLPEEIYASSATSSNFKYSHPLNHAPVDDGSMRARLAYDLMAFMHRDDCPYYMNPDSYSDFSPTNSNDEVDIMIVDGFYKEAEILLDQRLEKDPENEKAQFQKAFIQHLKAEYEKLLDREERILKNDPRNVNALINKGFALANLSREEEALITANKALRIDPENLTVLSNKAYIEKILCKDDMREQTLMRAYNVSAKNRMRELEHLESKLLKDFGSVFVEIDTPSAFDEFNYRSGATKSNMVH